MPFADETYIAQPENYRTIGRHVRKHGILVTMPDETVYTVRNLFTVESDNTKLAKNADDTEASRYLTVGLSLAPFTLAGMGNVCASASPHCAAGCLNTAGKGLVKDALGRETVQRARIAKTRALLSRDTRAWFVAALYEQIENHRRRASRKGLRLAVRLNVLSDLPFENMLPGLFSAFPDVQFYDYTKIVSRLGRTPSNYDLTFSLSETNERDALGALARGFRIAAVFSHRQAFPTFWRGFRVVNADAHDARFLDGPAVVCALKAKGLMRAQVGKSGTMVQA